MTVHFWGVRGSIPTPIAPEQVQAKILAAVERITPRDIETQDARTRFLATLPDWLFGSVGGNTPCVELITDRGTKFIFDAGTGIRELGIHSEPPKDFHYYLFMSHLHWDHIQGIPFWGAIYNPKAKIDVFSSMDDAEDYFSQQNSEPFFPANARWDNVKKGFSFHTVKNYETIYVEGVKITAKSMKHPGGSYIYCFEDSGKKFIYATDVELEDVDFETENEANAIFKDADAIILDSQYNMDDAEAKKNWGHNVFYRAVDFATAYNMKRLYLFHHEPTYSDQKIYSMLQGARWYAQSSEHADIEINLAIEGQTVEF